MQLYILEFTEPDSWIDPLYLRAVAVCTSVVEAQSIAEHIHGAPLMWETEEYEHIADAWYMSEVVDDYIADEVCAVIGTGKSVQRWNIRPCHLNKTFDNIYNIREHAALP